MLIPPKFTSIIEVKQHEGPLPKPVALTGKQAVLRKMLETSPNNYMVINEKTLPHVEIKITFEKGKHETAAMLASTLTLLLQKLNLPNI